MSWLQCSNIKCKIRIIPNGLVDSLKFVRLISAQCEAEEAAEAAAKSIVKAALEDPRQSLGQDRWFSCHPHRTWILGEHDPMMFLPFAVDGSIGILEEATFSLRQDNVTCVVAILK